MWQTEFLRLLRHSADPSEAGASFPDVQFAAAACGRGSRRTDRRRKSYSNLPFD
jgi:hypothetical protein